MVSTLTLVAVTATGNIASRRALERSGFEALGTRADDSGEQVIVWKKRLRTA